MELEITAFTLDYLVPGIGPPFSILEDRAITQAVSRWVLTVAAQIRGQVKSCRIYDG
jgi:hypothetical protein